MAASARIAGRGRRWHPLGLLPLVTGACNGAHLEGTAPLIFLIPLMLVFLFVVSQVMWAAGGIWSAARPPHLHANRRWPRHLRCVPVRVRPGLARPRSRRGCHRLRPA